MDPLTHTLVGATLARTRLGRDVPYATATMVLAANAPDIDVFAYLGGEDAGFFWRRGWSHGPVALVALPLVLVLGLVLWRRWRGGAAAASPWRHWLALAALGTLSHPVLDWLNSYGVRFLSPFSQRWYYGDTLFIVDPWLWLVLGGGLFLVTSGSRRAVVRWAALALVASLPVLAGPVSAVSKAVWLLAIVLLVALQRATAGPFERRGERIVTGAVAVAALYLGVMMAGAAAARALVAGELEASAAGPVVGLMVGPLPATPLRREVVVELEDRYLFGTFRWFGSPRLVWATGAERTAPSPAGAESRAALEDPTIRGFARWARFPYVELEESAGGVTDAWIFDGRYVRPPAPRRRGFGVAVVKVESRAPP